MDYQDALAVLGVGSAHPGGWDSTLLWLKEIPWESGMTVLDVGCGTGRTLLQVQRHAGCHVVDVDVRPKMVEKARQRASRYQQDASFAVASAEHLPFDEAHVDVLVTESVNVFVDTRRALREYFRVLKPGGWYVDVEMVLIGPATTQWKESARKVYGARVLLDVRGWKEHYQSTGFTEVRSLLTRPVRPGDMLSAEQKYPDDLDLADPNPYTDPQIIRILQSNAQWLEQNHRSLGYSIFIMRKPQHVG